MPAFSSPHRRPSRSAIGKSESEPKHCGRELMVPLWDIDPSVCLAVKDDRPLEENFVLRWMAQTTNRSSTEVF